MKLYYKDKVKIIEMYEQGVSHPAIALEYDVNKSTIKRIVRMYREYGHDILKDKTNNTSYTVDFKLMLVNRVLKGESKSSIGLEFGINPGTIYAWCKKYNDLGYNGLKQDLRGRPMNKTNKRPTKIKPVNKDDKIKLLVEENEQLKMELDLLKKLNALVQQRKEQPNKKR